jgi:hypothetical protein
MNKKISVFVVVVIGSPYIWGGVYSTRLKAEKFCAKHKKINFSIIEAKLN